MKERKNYLNYNPTTGDFLGFYDSWLFEEAAVPQPNIIISDETLVWLQTTGRYKINPDTKEFIRLKDPTPVDVDAELATSITAAKTLEELKAALLGSKGKAKVKGSQK